MFCDLRVLSPTVRESQPMSDNSKIEWTDATWNPVRGCTKISPGCAHCYAETFAERFRRNRDRKSTRLNSSHVEISYAVFCLKKKNEKYHHLTVYCRGDRCY